MENYGQWLIRGPKGYVAAPGSAKAYTRDPHKARRYPTKEAAEADKCGNEVVVRSPGPA